MWLHLEPYLSVSLPVGAIKSEGNKKIDTMLVQYFLLSLGTHTKPGYGDGYVDMFYVWQLRNGPFAVDGICGPKTKQMIGVYQSNAGNLGGEQKTSDIIKNLQMKVDCSVDRVPGRKDVFPLSHDSGGFARYIYAIAHMNERYKLLYPSYQDHIICDGRAPVELRMAVRNLLPPTGVGAQPVSGMASFHAARARQFPAPGR